MKNLLRIGVNGYSPARFNHKKALKYLKEAFDLVEKEYSGKNFAVVSGLTDLGIPGLAYHEAKRRNWKTIGIACSKALEMECFQVDEKRIVGREWGDESSIFIDSIDVLVRVGGNRQSLDEVLEAKVMNKRVIEYNLEEL